MKTPAISRAALMVTLSCFCCGQFAAAGSATWNLNPPSGDWNTAANWTPATVPNGASDTATFDVSNTTAVSLSASTETNGLVFNPGASRITITVSQPLSLVIDGAGVANNSGTAQHFFTRESGGSQGLIMFMNSATAGAGNVFTNSGSGLSELSPGGITRFFDNSSAGSATVTNLGGRVSQAYGGWVEFFGTSTAASATINLNGGTDNGSLGGVALFHESSTAGAASALIDGGHRAGLGAIVQFSDSASAGSATFTANGGVDPDTGGSSISFTDSASAGSAMLITNGGIAELAGGGLVSLSDTSSAGGATLVAHGSMGIAAGAGSISFLDSATGGTARVEVFSDGFLDVSSHSVPGVTIGSLEGDGLVTLGANNLTAGTNRLSTTFSGVISGSGSLTKIGSGKLILSGANTYTGQTQVRQGSLFIQDLTGSLTVINGNVVVAGGTFGGSGLVSGAVTIGGASGRPATLEPNQLHGGNFIIHRSLTFNSGATCNVDVNSSAGLYSSVSASRVTINAGALFTITDSGNSVLGGANLPIINNTGSMPIAGQFANLPEGGTIVVGPNTYHATYQGGDGNDFVLTIEP